jgi:hypothetical protein
LSVVAPTVGNVDRPTSAAGDAARLFTLVTQQADWIHRRVDRVDLEEDGETTRRTSFDLTVPPEQAIVRCGGLVVPLMLMRKVPLRRLDTAGPDGPPAPVLGRDDNGAMVVSMLRHALAGAVGADSDGLEQVVRDAVMEREPDRIVERVQALREEVEGLTDESGDEVEAVLALADDLAHHFLFAVLVPEDAAGRRVVVKVSMAEEIDDRARDWAFKADARSMDISLRAEGASGSGHLEFRAPLGLRVASVKLLDRLDEPLEPAGPSIDRGHTAHLTGLERVAVGRRGGRPGRARTR